MSGLKRCIACHQLSDPRADRCWVCGGALVSDAPASHPSLPGGEGDVALRLIAWVVLVLGLAMVSLIVAIELALNWPGLLIPFGFVMVVVFGAIARTAYVHHKASRESPAPSVPHTPGPAATGPRPGPRGPSTTEAVLSGLALAAATVAVVLGLLILLGVAAVILFFMVCFAMLGAGSFH